MIEKKEDYCIFFIVYLQRKLMRNVREWNVCNDRISVSTNQLHTWRNLLQYIYGNLYRSIKKIQRDLIVDDDLFKSMIITW